LQSADFAQIFQSVID